MQCIECTKVQLNLTSVGVVNFPEETTKEIQLSQYNTKHNSFMHKQKNK
jgi:hypothetical protein